ncbi:hypothetical protein [Phenylobacterium montanum]|uniref:Uncharacterized protein n=1 Tax=Phenylobacterium montanum TaxID=2823693 RepID=A0A975FW72_9CAUL|nr:hypothetical protein [Caulobacter sp. S6]QUD86425.1 hypothetical protein KCG34_15140 [Caulobacter sp. S6]
MRRTRLGLLLTAALCASGCAMTPLPPPTASLDNVQALRSAGLAPMRTGTFVAGPGRPTEMDHSIAVRAGVQPAPGGSFAKYLGDTLQAELKGAGRLDPNATLVVSGVVTDTHVDSAMPTAHAALAAKFTLVRDGRPVFEKTLRVEDHWDSDFMGAVAIPDAFNHYTGLFPKLIGALLADADFRAAAKAG